MKYLLLFFSFFIFACSSNYSTLKRDTASANTPELMQISLGYDHCLGTVQNGFKDGNYIFEVDFDYCNLRYISNESQCREAEFTAYNIEEKDYQNIKKIIESKFKIISEYITYLDDSKDTPLENEVKIFQGRDEHKIKMAARTPENEEIKKIRNLISENKAMLVKFNKLDEKDKIEYTKKANETIASLEKLLDERLKFYKINVRFGRTIKYTCK